MASRLGEMYQARRGFLGRSNGSCVRILQLIFKNQCCINYRKKVCSKRRFRFYIDSLRLQLVVGFRSSGSQSCALCLPPRDHYAKLDYIKVHHRAGLPSLILILGSLTAQRQIWPYQDCDLGRCSTLMDGFSIGLPVTWNSNTHTLILTFVLSEPPVHVPTR
jgi:hypothetical protein